MAVTAIPTSYGGQRFRSRLEAKWAAFFDRAEWRWSYEPDDLDGCVPDFKLWLHRPVLIEVKPVQWDDSLTDEDIMMSARTKIIHSGYQGEALLLGTRIVTGDEYPHQRIGAIMHVEVNGDVSPWYPAFAFRCDACGRFSFADEINSWHCRVKGCYDGDGHLGDWNADFDFRRACSEVQWRPR
jgi:hypothetical protein